MAAGRRNNQGGNTKYLTPALGAFWQKGGYSTDSEFYAEEHYEIGGEKKVTKGLKFDNISGFIQSVYFKENDYGEFVNIYIEDTDEDLWCLQFKIDRAWTSYNLAKRAIIALMSLDKASEVTFNISGNKEDGSDFLNVVMWVSQNGKNLVLNPDTEDINEDKQTPIPDDVLGDLLDIETPSKDERVAMSKKQKAKAREDELDELVDLFKVKYLETINEKNESEQQDKDESTEEGEDTEPEKVKDEVEKEEPVEKELTPREKRLAELKARKKK